MFSALTTLQKEAIAFVGLSILGASYGGKIRTNEPDIFSLFVDLFDVNSQEDIFPILQNILQLGQENATAIISQLNINARNEFREYMLAKSKNDSRRLLALACVMQNIG